MVSGDEEALKVFIVEDEAVIALDIGSMVQDAGFEVIGEADTCARACSHPALSQADVVLLDVQLADGSSGVDVYHYLTSRFGSIPVFLTANRNLIPGAVSDDTALMSKPVSRGSFEQVLRFLNECVKHPPPELAVPDDLTIGRGLLKRIS